MDKEERHDKENHLVALHLLEAMHEGELKKENKPFIDELVKEVGIAAKNREHDKDAKAIVYDALSSMTAEGKSKDPHFRSAAVMYNELFQRTPKVDDGINHWSDEELDARLEEKLSKLRKSIPYDANGPYIGGTLETHLNTMYFKMKDAGVYDNSREFHKRFTGLLKKMGEGHVSKGGWRPPVEKPKVLTKKKPRIIR